MFGTINIPISGLTEGWTVCCHPAYLTYMQRTSCEMPDWMKPKLESKLQGEISIFADIADDTTLMAESKEKLKSLLMKVKEESEKAGLKVNSQTAKNMASIIFPLFPHLFARK